MNAIDSPWERFADGEMGFSHRAHLQLAYEALGEGGLAQVLPPIDRTLRRMARAHGQPEKFHATLTTLWLMVVQERLAREPAESFEAFLAANDDLLDSRGLPRRYYHEATLADPVARRVFVLPDRLDRSQSGGRVAER